MNKYTFYNTGQVLTELLVAIGIMGIILPVLLTSFVSSRLGKPQQQQRMQAISILEETVEAVRSVREKGWTTFATNGTYYPTIVGSSWLLSEGTITENGFTKQVVIEDVERANGSGEIVASGGYIDPSTKKVTITISWLLPMPSSIDSVMYYSRYLDNLSYSQTSQAEFNANNNTQVNITNISGGEVEIDPNNKAKWCSPSFSSSTIDLPDGPPVAVAAKANATNALPNDVFVATAPTATSSVKLAYVNVTANTDPPASSLRGKFSLDAAQYSNSSYVPTGISLDNNFKTNDIAYYTSSSNKTYALMGTNLPDKEVVAVLVNDNDSSNDATTAGEYADPVNKIYKYWTYFNTTIYNASDTGFRDATANAVVTGGDNNGFQSNVTRAYSDNNSFAIDSNSGSGNGVDCTGSDKDKHQFYNYGFSIPSGAAINGIEIRLDARVDNISGSPKMCVQLSWDSGATWTTAKSTPTLSTNEATYILGGANDTWGRTWTGNNLTNTNFRMRISNVASNTSRDFSLDWAAVNVYYNGGTPSTNDQSPFGYGGVTLSVLEDRGYVASGGYLYVFDLSTIDSKTTNTPLDMVGCRIELDGYECLPGDGTDRKYSAGQTGTTWSSTTSPVHPETCADGGNIELYATNDIYPVKSGNNTYIYAAVGAGTNPEFNIANVTDVPNTTTSPSVSSSSCGRSSGGANGWKKVGSYDFNTSSGTEEAANSVFAKSDGTRAYISSNGGNDSKQFYILNTTNKSSPSFLSGANNGSGPATGYYNGSGANGELFPRRSLTVLNGQRVVLVGKDGVINGNDGEEYQVLNAQNEDSPTYCSGINFDAGFNDLTSVSEADLDNFVYMVTNTTLNELKIIQGGPDGTYLDTGIVESQTIDPGYSTVFNNFVATTIRPSGTSLGFQFAGADPINGSCNGANFIFTGPSGTSDLTDLYPATGSALLLDNDGNGYENPAQCFRYKAFLSTTDANQTPQLLDVSINYSP